MIRVVIADDQEMVRDGFAMILSAQPDIEVVGLAAHGAAVLALAHETEPDVVLMDVRMPGMDGLETTRRLLGRRDGERPRVLILTTFDVDEYIYEALKAGASGFLLKDAPRAQLLAGVRAVAAGESLLAPAITRRLIEEFVRRRPPAQPPPAVQSLSEREREVLLLLARGLSNAELGARLFLSEATVKTHVAHVLAKLGLPDRVQAVVLAYETGLVTPGDAGRVTP